MLSFHARRICCAVVIAICSLVSVDQVQGANVNPIAQPPVERSLDLTAIAVSVWEIAVSWSFALGTARVTGYRLWRNDQLLATVDAGTRTYADTAVRPATRYRYRIAALGSAGLAAPETVDVQTPPLPATPDTQPPTPPYKLRRGDTIRITVMPQGAPYNQDLQIQPDGRFFYPVVGEVVAVG